jgi:hypothetical protein
MSVALNLHTKRIYIRGDITTAYRWLTDLFDRNHMIQFSMPFMLIGDAEEPKIVPHSAWTVEYDPAPLEKAWVRNV